jgi:hypothetical protein
MTSAADSTASAAIPLFFFSANNRTLRIFLTGFWLMDVVMMMFLLSMKRQKFVNVKKERKKGTLQ